MRVLTSIFLLTLAVLPTFASPIAEIQERAISCNPTSVSCPVMVPRLTVLNCTAN